MKLKASKCSLDVLRRHELVANLVTILRWRQQNVYKRVNCVSQKNKQVDSALKLAVALVIAILAASVAGTKVKSKGFPTQTEATPEQLQQRQQEFETYARNAAFWKNLRTQDTCGTVSYLMPLERVVGSIRCSLSSSCGLHKAATVTRASDARTGTQVCQN